MSLYAQLCQFDAAAWRRAVDTLSASVHPIDRNAVRIWFAFYPLDLFLALERAEDGAIEWVSDAKIESYHTLWFALHEDLLCMLGRARQE